jgi:hypothetical protein
MITPFARVSFLASALLGLMNACSDIEPADTESSDDVASAGQALPVPVYNAQSQRYDIVGSVTLEPNGTYSAPFDVQASSTLDCNNSTIILPASLNTNAIRIAGSGVVLKNCNIEGSSGISTTGEFNNVLVQNVKLYHSTGQGMMMKLTDSWILDCIIHGSQSVGIQVLGGERNTISRNIIEENGSGQDAGVIIDGSQDNLFEDNWIQNNGRHGVEIYRNCGEKGGAPRPNEARNNTFRRNTIRGHHVGGKAADYNDIRDGKGRDMSGSHRLGLGAGIAIASRQGLTLWLQQTFKYRTYGDVDNDCSASLLTGSEDKRCNNTGERYERHLYERTTDLGTVSGTNGRMSPDIAYVTYLPAKTCNAQGRAVDADGKVLDDDKARDVNVNSLYDRVDTSGRPIITTNQMDAGSVPPNYDYAANTDVDGNRIYNNDIGVLAADQETRIVNNLFHYGTGASSYNAFADVFVGNVNLDYSTGGPKSQSQFRYVRAMFGNDFDSTRNGYTTGYNCRVSTSVAQSRINGSDRSFCAGIARLYPYRI